MLRLALLSLMVLSSACTLTPNTQMVGQLSLAASFKLAADFRTLVIPDATRAVAVAVFSETDGALEAGLVLTPEMPTRRIGLLMPGRRKVLAVAFDANAQALAGDDADATIVAGQTERAELDLQADFRPSQADLVLLRALLRQPQVIVRPGQALPLEPSPSALISASPAPVASPEPKPQPSPTASASPLPMATPSATPYPSSGDAT